MKTTTQKINNNPFAPTESMPSNIDLEHQVLSAILMDGNVAFEAVEEFLNADCFFDNKARIVYRAMANIYDNNDEIDGNTVIQQLKKMKLFKKMGNHSFLASLDNPSPSNSLKQHACILVELFLRRAGIMLGEKMAKKGYDDSIDVFDYLDSFTESSFQIVNNYIPQKKQSVAQGLGETLKKIEGFKNEKTAFESGYPARHQPFRDR